MMSQINPTMMSFQDLIECSQLDLERMHPEDLQELSSLVHQVPVVILNQLLLLKPLDLFMCQLVLFLKMKLKLILKLEELSPSVLTLVS